MPWYFFVSLAVASFSVITIMQRLILKESNSRPLAFAIFTQFLTGIIITIIGFATTEMRFPENVPLWNLLLVPVTYGVGMIFSYSGLKLLEASKFVLVFSMRIVFSIIGASFFLHETLDFLQLFGVALVLFGVILVNLQHESAKNRKGELFTLIASFFFGVGMVNDRFLLASFDVYPYVSFGFFAPALLIAIIQPKEIMQIKTFLQKRLLIKSLLVCVLFTIGAIGFNTALKTGPGTPQVLVANTTNIIFTVILSMIVLKERSHLLKKLIATALTFIGLLFVL